MYMLVIMKFLKLIFVVIIFTSCSTSSSVVHNGFLQKRKYNKGYNFSFKKKNKKQSSASVPSLVFAEGQKNKKEYYPPVKQKEEQVALKQKKESPLYASVGNNEMALCNIKLPQLVGDTIVEEYVRERSSEVSNGIQKIRIKRSKLYMLLSIVGMGLFIVGVAVFPLLGVFGKIVFVPFLLGVVGLYAAVFNLVKYSEAKFSVMKNPNGRDIKLLNRSRRLNNFSKFTLLFFVISILLLFAIVFLSTLSPDLILLLTILWFVIYLHFIVFLIMTYVNYIILYFSQRKEMKYDMSK